MHQFLVIAHDAPTTSDFSLDDIVTYRLSLGPEALHADQAITVAHDSLDTAGFTDY